MRRASFGPPLGAPGRPSRVRRPLGGHVRARPHALAPVAPHQEARRGRARDRPRHRRLRHADEVSAAAKARRRAPFLPPARATIAPVRDHLCPPGAALSRLLPPLAGDAQRRGGPGSSVARAGESSRFDPFRATGSPPRRRRAVATDADDDLRLCTRRRHGRDATIICTCTCTCTCTPATAHLCRYGVLYLMPALLEAAAVCLLFALHFGQPLLAGASSSSSSSSSWFLPRDWGKTHSPSRRVSSCLSRLPCLLLVADAARWW